MWLCDGVYCYLLVTWIESCTPDQVTHRFMVAVYLSIVVGPVGAHLFEMYAYCVFWILAYIVGCLCFWNFEGHSVVHCFWNHESREVLDTFPYFASGVLHLISSAVLGSGGIYHT